MNTPEPNATTDMEEAAQELGMLYKDLANLRAKVHRVTIKAVELASREHDCGIQEAGEEHQRLIELKEKITESRTAIRIVRTASKKGSISARRLEQACAQASEALQDARDTLADIGL